MSVPAAREMVGQPHLADPEMIDSLGKAYGGPVHIVACLGNVTVAQAQRMLGFPNATVVSADFGVYVVDPMQGIQIVLIANCAEDDATRHGVQRFLEWLPQSDQDSLLVKYAAERKAIVSLMAGRD